MEKWRFLVTQHEHLDLAMPEAVATAGFQACEPIHSSSYLGQL